MRVAVVDVGSNTVRLLVAEAGPEGVAPLADEKAFHWLGAEIARSGAPGPATLAAVAETARAFARVAREHDVERLETIVTAPGRRQGAGPLLAALHDATGAPVRVLSAEQEGRLAWEGAVVRASDLPEVVGVVDVGGGSTEIVVGTPLSGAAWVRSLEIGSLGLAHIWFRADPPGPAEVERARAAVRAALAAVDPPLPDRVFATGGSARTAARILGRRFGAAELDGAIPELTRRPARETAVAFGLQAERARTIAAGAVILAETARLLGRPLERARGGLREGAAMALAYQAAAAA